MHYIRPESAAVESALGLYRAGRFWRLHVVHCTIGEVRNQTTHPAHTHDFYHVVLFEAGKNRFVLDGALVASRPGTLVLCPPGVSHDFGPHDAGRTSYHEITFQLADGVDLLAGTFGDLLSEYAGQATVGVPYLLELSPADAARMMELIRKVAEALLQPGVGAQLRAAAGMLEVLAGVVELVHSGSPGAVRDPAEVAYQQILLRFAEPVAIAEVAELAGVSEAHLCRTFRGRYGKSPVEFRQELRLAAAARLLQTSSLSCKEIAARLGFADVQTFTKAFARHHGQTPGALAKALRAVS